MSTTADKLNYLISTKNAIKQAIIDKGVNVTDTDTFRSYATKIGEIQSGGGELPAYMSAKNFTFDGNACTGYVGDNTLPEIIIPKSYSTVTSTETVAGAKVLDKENLSMSIYDFQSVTFSDGGTNTQTYTSTSQLQNLSTDFPNDCYLVSMQGSNPFSFNFLQMASDMQMLQFPIAVNGQSFSDGMTAFDYIIQNNITNVNFDGDVKIITFIDGDDYQVTSVSGSSNGSGFKNYQNRIILLSNLTSIGDSAFQNCSGLTSIEIPSSVTSIGDSAFEGCSSLASIEIPSSVTSIGDSAFYGCSGLTSIEIPSSVTSIGTYAFRYCSSLESIEIPNSVTSIERYAFEGCSSLASIEIPNSVTSIGDSAFEGCSSLASIEIPNSVTSIGTYAFQNCSSLTSIEIPSSVTSIGISTFRDCRSLTSIEIPNSVTSIGTYAFRDCRSLTSIEIPNSVTSIGTYAFRDCRSLTTMTVLPTTPPTLDNTNAISTATKKIYIPAGTLSAYQSATNWSKFASLFEELPS